MKSCVITINGQTIAGFVVGTEEILKSNEERYIVSTENGELLSVSKELVTFN